MTAAASRRTRRFPLTLTALAGSAIAIPLYLVAGSTFQDAQAPRAEAATVAATATAASADDRVSSARAEPAATPAPAERGSGHGAKKGESDFRRADTASLEAAAPPAMPPHAGDEMLEEAGAGRYAMRGLGGDAPSARILGGGFDDQLQVNRLTAGRTSDLIDRSSIDELRSIALAQDQALAQAIGSNDRVAAAPRPGTAPRAVDIGLVLDTTGSMGDELAYLKVELRSIAQAVAQEYPGVSQRFALVAYRDHGDEYVVRTHDFAPLDEFLGNLGVESAGGGGDMPEALDLALDAATELQWNSQGAAQLMFLVADAPPHAADYSRYVHATTSLADRSISVYPVASSGVDTVCEYLMRWAARTTGGEYLFLTDHSGIGSSHADPHVQQYELKTLRDHMLQVIRLELGAQPQEQTVFVAARDGVGELECFSGERDNWWNVHGLFAAILGGVFLLGFAGDTVLNHGRRRSV